MTRQTRSLVRCRPTPLIAVLLTGLLALSARPAAAQFIATWVPEQRTDPGPTIGAGFAVTHDGERPVELVVLAHRIRDGRVVDTYTSGSFRVAPGRPFRLGERHLPTPRFYDGKVAGQIVTAPAPVPVASGERDVNAWWENVQERGDITDWEAARDIEEWRRRDALLLVVAPADARLRRSALAYPKLVRLEAPSR